MRLPFTHDEFLDVFGAYNTLLWPLEVILWLLTATVLAAGISSPYLNLSRGSARHPLAGIRRGLSSLSLPPHQPGRCCLRDCLLTTGRALPLVRSSSISSPIRVGCEAASDSWDWSHHLCFGLPRLGRRNRPSMASSAALRRSVPDYFANRGLFAHGSSRSIASPCGYPHPVVAHCGLGGSRPWCNARPDAAGRRRLVGDLRRRAASARLVACSLTARW